MEEHELRQYRYYVNHFVGTTEERDKADQVQRDVFRKLGLLAVFDADYLIKELETAGRRYVADLIREAVKATEECERLWKLRS